MDRAQLPRGVAFAVAFAIVSAINFYTFDRLSGLLGIGCWQLSFGYAIALSTLLLVGFLVRTSSGRGTKGLFVAVTTVYGLEFAAISALIPFEILDLLLELPDFESGAAILAFIAALAIISAANAQTLHVRTIKMRFVKRMKVVQLSDVHLGAVHGKRYLARIVGIVNGLEPDLVLITGDMVSGAVAPGGSQLEGFSGLKARTVMAPGNHEYYEGMDEIRAALPKNVEILRDAEIDMGEYSVFGLDYTQDQGMSGVRKLDRKFSKPTIVMAHVPQFLDLPRGSIILSGHYHAGQVFPFNFLGHAFIKLFRGVYEKDGTTLYVSPGTATWGPPMRFGSRNEITLLELGPGQ